MLCSRAISLNWQVKQAVLAIQAASGASSPARIFMDTIVKSGFPLVRSPSQLLSSLPMTDVDDSSRQDSAQCPEVSRVLYGVRPCQHM